VLGVDRLEGLAVKLLAGGRSANARAAPSSCICSLRSISQPPAARECHSSYLLPLFDRSLALAQRG
jgi:hypothetical protein